MLVIADTGPLRYLTVIDEVCCCRRKAKVLGFRL